MAYTGEIAALSTVLCWAIGTLSFEAAGRRIGSTTVNFIRLTMAWGMLAIVGVATSEYMLIPARASGEMWLWLGMSGVIGFFLGDLCLFRAFILIGPRLCTLVFTLAPLMTALLGWVILGETLTPLNCLGMAITLCGVGWVVAERKVDASVKFWRPSVWGVSLAAMGALGQALGMVLAKKVINENTNPITVTQIRITAALPAFAIMFLALRWYPRVAKGLKNGRAMAQMTLGAFVGPVLGVVLLMLSMKHLEAAVAQTFVALLPIVIIPFVMVIHKERVSLRAALGAVMAVAGVAILFIKDNGDLVTP
ncbi:MAG: DMT family transporter [Phycisphaerae bacterium]|jgi:drug/metabolite transporter (DMT)-like permease|nr:DMT family transporter [Phycisphaerae bacterium]